MKFIKTFIPIFILTIFFSGCMGDYVTREEFEVLESSISRRINRINYDLNITKGAINENRGGLEILQEQIKEISSRLGMLNENLKNIDTIESKFNKKLHVVMDEVIKENERLLKEINKNRGLTPATQTRSNSDTNIYNQSRNKNLDVGYYHVVARGESLSKIANKYKVPIDDIINANGINNPDALYIGQKLFIPDPREEE